ncbi:MAG: hypothetical protein Tsb0027_17880 [Wenzhouxiangellaceae bacterium]
MHHRLTFATGSQRPDHGAMQTELLQWTQSALHDYFVALKPTLDIQMAHQVVAPCLAQTVAVQPEMPASPEKL